MDKPSRQTIYEINKKRYTFPYKLNDKEGDLFRKYGVTTRSQGESIRGNIDLGRNFNKDDIGFRMMGYGSSVSALMTFQEITEEVTIQQYKHERFRIKINDSQGRKTHKIKDMNMSFIENQLRNYINGRRRIKKINLGG